MTTYGIVEELDVELCGDVDSVAQAEFNSKKRFSMDFSVYMTSRCHSYG